MTRSGLEMNASLSDLLQIDGQSEILLHIVRCDSEQSSLPKETTNWTLQPMWQAP